MPKYDALILNTDGSKKFFEIGCALAFEQFNTEFDAVATSGIGVINAALIMQKNTAQMIKFWTMALNTDLLKITQIIAGKYEQEWSVLRDKVFVEEFCKFLLYDEALTPLKRTLGIFVDESTVRNSGIKLYLNTINLTTLNYEVISLDQIPSGQLHSYMLLCICFPEISRFRHLDTYKLSSVNLLNRLEDLGYRNILSSEEYVDTVPSQSVTIIKSSDFLEIENNYSVDVMKTHLKTGFLDALKAIGKLCGKYYYIRKEDDREYYYFSHHIGDEYNDNRDYLIKSILGIDTLTKKEANRKLKMLIKKTAYRKEEDYIISLTEILAQVLNIEDREIYTFSEIKKVITAVAKAEMTKGIKKINNKEILREIVENTTGMFILNKEMFIEYFLILLSADEKNYSKLKIIFNTITNEMKLAILALIYMLY